MHRKILISLGLLLATIAVYWQLSQCDFINYDDPDYIVKNPRINHGFTIANVTWAFTHTLSSNWHPLTSFSLMLDCQFFGLNATASHLVNLLFHAMNALLLFFVLEKMTREPWPSAVVAALFALHPLHVESVAWISERKDVLSTLFFLLTICAYAHFAEFKIKNSKSGKWSYTLALLFFALGLLSKPMLVTTPFVLLLLDYWPLGRFKIQGSIFKNLIAEKIPFFALAIGSSIVTFLVQRETGAVMDITSLTIPDRLFNAIISYVRYIGKTFWPASLSIFYPHPGHWPAWQILLSSILLIAVTVIVVWKIRRRPYLAAGWFWFLGTLVPVIGIVQVGGQSLADRYTYIPLIGIFLALVWLLKDLRLPKTILISASFLTLAACASATLSQVSLWKNSEKLFRHALAATGPSAPAYFSLGNALLDKGKTEDGIAQFEKALALDPNRADIHGQIATILAKEGKFSEAVERYKKVLGLKPTSSDALNNLAWLLATCPDDSIRNGAEAVRLGEQVCKLTHWQTTRYIGTLAAAYAESGRFDDAIRTAESARALALETGEQDLVVRNSQLLELYRTRRAFHEPSK